MAIDLDNNSIHQAAKRGAENAARNSRPQRSRGGVSKSAVADLETFVAHCVADVVDRGGYVNRRVSDERGIDTTGQAAVGRIEDGVELTERARVGARKVLDFVNEQDQRTNEKTNDFIFSLCEKVAHARQYGVSRRTAGFVASSVVAYMNAQDRKKKAQEAQAASAIDCPATRINEMFGKALAAIEKRGQKKSPKIVVKLGDPNDPESKVVTQVVQFKPAKKDSSIVYVNDGGPYKQDVYYGKIVDGKFFPSRDCNPAVAKTVVDLATNPVGVAKAHAKLTSSCCFCNKELTDGRSIAKAYGPVCAENYGLPWGDEKVSTNITIEEEAASAAS